MRVDRISRPDRYFLLVQTGDEVLRKVVDLFEKALRAEEVPARFGGEEFAILARGKAPGSDRAAPRPAVGAATGGHAAATPSAQPVAPVAPVAPPTPDAAPADVASQAPAASSPGTN